MVRFRSRVRPLGLHRFMSLKLKTLKKAKEVLEGKKSIESERERERLWHLGSTRRRPHKPKKERRATVVSKCFCRRCCRALEESQGQEQEKEKASRVIIVPMQQPGGTSISFWSISGIYNNWILIPGGMLDWICNRAGCLFGYRTCNNFMKLVKSLLWLWISWLFLF
jgi:hypothetical protein